MNSISHTCSYTQQPFSIYQWLIGVETTGVPKLCAVFLNFPDHVKDIGKVAPVTTNHGLKAYRGSRGKAA
jgi:hypothetical protein